MIRKLIGLYSVLFFLGNVSAQTLSKALKSQKLFISSDTIFTLDTLSLVPNTVRLKNLSGKPIDTSLYRIDYAKAVIEFEASVAPEDSLIITYKTFPYSFSESVQHKEKSLLERYRDDTPKPFLYTPSKKKSPVFSMGNIDKTGSISRGISFGNNQDLSVNSSLNLQLSGKLDNGVHILLAATDNNIPIQPDGNTQQLQDFDQVFVQLSKDSSVMIAGDYQLQKPNGYFMSFNKKAQGIKLSTVKEISLKNKLKGRYAVKPAGALSRGKFARNLIQGLEGNQGPYRLVGAENEPFIVVLSGTERVYLDGVLLVRGQENDYVVDYNTAEITFTAKQLITKDKRIVVQFQYADNNYARSLFYVGNSYEQGRMKLHLDLYSEQDTKSQPLQQDLSDAQKQLLSEIGDSLSLAVGSSVDSVEYSANEILYKKVDTVVGGVLYSILAYSTNADSAKFRASFSDLGNGNGNYIQLVGNANGRVFSWVAPDSISGLPQGRFEPVVTLVTPKKKQLLAGGVDFKFNANTKLFLEGAVSRNDKNTFSAEDASDDLGYALKLKLDNKRMLKKDSLGGFLTLVSSINYEYVGNSFSPIERYRSIEFERDWSRRSLLDNDAEQHLSKASFVLNNRRLGFLEYNFSSLLEGEDYNGVRNGVRSKLKHKGLVFNYDGSVLSSSDEDVGGLFYRHFSGISQKIKNVRIGLKDQLEYNKKTDADSLLLSSYHFWEWAVFLENADSSGNKYGLEYFQRNDFGVRPLANEEGFKKATLGENYSAYVGFGKNPARKLNVRLTYRSLRILDTLITSNVRENSLLSRLEYTTNLWKGLVLSSSFYEISSGLELKKEFEYIEVPAGQGVYTWIDYNQNDIKELNEFEVAAFSGDASFIRVFTPSQEYAKVYRNQFSQQLTVKPRVVWKGEKGFRGLMARMVNQTVYKLDRRSSDLDYQKFLNPFRVNDSSNLGLTSLFRNTLFFNQRSPIWGLNLTYQNNNNATLLVNGVDTRSQAYWEGKLRWNITRKYSGGLLFKNGQKAFESVFLSDRNYQINYQEIVPNLAYQPSTGFRINAVYKYVFKQNEFGVESSLLNNYGLELKYNVLQKGSLNASLNYINVKYDGEGNTSLAYEMLDALQVGKNYTWTARYQRNLANNMQVSINYEGRQSEGVKVIHSGGAQVRAYF